MHVSVARIFEVLDIGDIEAVEILRLHYIRRAPVAVAVHDAVLKPAVLLRYLVERYDEPVLSAEPYHRRHHEVIRHRHLERLETRRDYLRAQLCRSRKSHK